MSLPRPERGPVGVAEDLAGRSIGRYEILCLLATGGMASVYAARAVGIAGFQRLLAIKVLHPHLAHEEDFIAMFLDEARLAARIHHPNVVATHDVSDSAGDGFFLVMDYIEGHHLGALLQQASREDAPIPTPVAVRLVLDALAGLGAAHALVDEHGASMQLVHRDVSPHNIMVGIDGVARLTDFGVAKAEVRLSFTREGQFKGKIAYMSPEHAAGLEVDQRSDVFSAGIVLWETLTGRRLFQGETSAQILRRVLDEDVAPPSSVNAALAPFDAIAQKALARRRAARFAGADEFAEALEKVALAHGGVATPRQVGDVVRRLTAEKLSSEKERIQRAIDELGRGAGPAAERAPASSPEPRTSHPGPTPPEGKQDSGTHAASREDSLPFEPSNAGLADATRAASPLAKVLSEGSAPSGPVASADEGAPLAPRDTELVPSGSELARHPTVAALPARATRDHSEPAEPTRPRAEPPRPPPPATKEPQAMSRLGRGFIVALAAAWLAIVATVLVQELPGDSSAPVVTPLPFDPSGPLPQAPPAPLPGGSDATDEPLVRDDVPDASPGPVERRDAAMPRAPTKAPVDKAVRPQRPAPLPDDVLPSPYRVR